MFSPRHIRQKHLVVLYFTYEITPKTSKERSEITLEEPRHCLRHISVEIYNLFFVLSITTSL